MSASMCHVYIPCKLFSQKECFHFTGHVLTITISIHTSLLDQFNFISHISHEIERLVKHPISHPVVTILSRLDTGLNVMSFFMNKILLIYMRTC